MINDTEVPYMIVGDPAYPLLPWLMKNYTRARGRPLTPEEDSFNVYLNKARVSVEMAFGWLKGRFRVLLKRVELHHSFAPFVVSACCVLHNIIITLDDPFPNDWWRDVQNGNQIFPQPQPRHRRQYVDYNAVQLRDSLKGYLSDNFPLLQSFQARI